MFLKMQHPLSGSPHSPKFVNSSALSQPPRRLTPHPTPQLPARRLSRLHGSASQGACQVHSCDPLQLELLLLWRMEALARQGEGPAGIEQR